MNGGNECVRISKDYLACRIPLGRSLKSSLRGKLYGSTLKDNI